VGIWPTGGETLRGVFEFRERSNWAVRTEDGTLWLLRPDAEEQLRALTPDEGQDVQVMRVTYGVGRSKFHVSVH
jgi:hypothetical protein